MLTSNLRKVKYEKVSTNVKRLQLLVKRKKNPDAFRKYSIIQQLNAEQQALASSAGSA